jgi:hypothetical protein
MDMVLLLDFTNSMASWEEEGTTAIDLMVAWAHDLIDSLAPAHRLAIMEYHDRNLAAGVIAEFTANRSLLHESLDDFLATSIDHGSSRNWDALAEAIDMFTGDPLDGRRRMVVAITDGRETSSELTPAEVTSRAGDWLASVFIIGTGEISNEATLGNLAEQTGGEYYAAANIESFSSDLEQIKRDLGGQYRLSYVTLRTSGSYKVRVELDYEAHAGAFEQLLDLGSIFGDDRIGRIVLLEPERRAGLLQALYRAEHVPRNIDRFRFQLDTDKPFTISLPTAAEGGLCEDWQLTGPDYLGWYSLISEEPLPFGAFGLLWEFEIRDVLEADIFFEFTLDTTVYTGGKTFEYPRYIVVENPEFFRDGFETGDIQPLFGNRSAQPWAISTADAFAGNYAASCGEFSSAGGSSLTLELDVGFADTLFFQIRLASEVDTTGNGFFEFYLDGESAMSYLGELPWTEVVVPIEAGLHKFTWRLLVNEADVAASPRVWIDEIVLR